MVTLLTCINIFICVLRSLLYPLILFLGIFVPYLRNRLAFEKKNISEASSRSFNKDDLKADIALEVSSEGELEQVRPLIMSELNRGKRIELLYSSESVENKCKKLFEDYKDQLRIYRMPLLSFSLMGGQNIFRFITADTLILCRYDFFPELLLLGLKKCQNFILVSATLKNKSLKNWLVRLILKGIYHHFNFIICATETDLESFHKYLKITKSKLLTYDFRIVQILSRVKKAREVLASKTFFQYYDRWINGVDKKSRIIFGSIWPLEMPIFVDQAFKKAILEGQLKCLLAPHKLGEDFIKELTSKIDPELPYYLIDRDLDDQSCQKVFDQMDKRPGLLIITVPAILCELYSTVSNAYVGGGHGRSIHSVLEPYVGMCRVFCGPKIHRSTEYDLINDYSQNQIHVVTILEDFYKIFRDNYMKELDLDSRTKIFNQVLTDYEPVIERLMSKKNYV